MTPEEIVNRDIKQALRGYAMPDVDQLLDELADQIEREQAELAQLRAQLAAATSRLEETQAKLDHAREAESTLSRTLVTAQEAAERSLAAAQREADDLRAAAERDATAQREEAHAAATQQLQEAQASAAAQLEEARASAAAQLEEARATATAQREEARAAALSLLEQAKQAASGEIERARSMQAVNEHHRTTMRRHLETQLATLDELVPFEVPELHTVTLASLEEGATASDDADDGWSEDGTDDAWSDDGGHGHDEVWSGAVGEDVADGHDDGAETVGVSRSTDDPAAALTVRIRSLEDAAAEAALDARSGHDGEHHEGEHDGGADHHGPYPYHEVAHRGDEGQREG
jgi:DivIVA domain-containing protein